MGGSLSFLQANGEKTTNNVVNSQSPDAQESNHVIQGTTAYEYESNDNDDGADHTFSIAVLYAALRVDLGCRVVKQNHGQQHRVVDKDQLLNEQGSTLSAAENKIAGKGVSNSLLNKQVSHCIHKPVFQRFC